MQPARQQWLDRLKGLAIAWIFLNHAAERVFGGPYFSNPTGAWPPLEERIAQAAPLSGHGWLDIPANLVRYLGWFGDQGVQLFIVASGFGLAWGLLRRQEDTVDLRAMLWRRALRLFPLWWGAHAVFSVWRVATGYGPLPLEKAFWASALGIRFLPQTWYYGAPAWWYIGLQLQLYLVLPFLWVALSRWGAKRVLLATCAVTFTARLAGFYVFTDYLDAWERGAFFVTRLPEFVFGLVLARIFFQNPDRAGEVLRRPSSVLGGLALWAIGTGVSFTAEGMVVMPILTAVGLVPPVYALLRVVGPRAGRALDWLGAHSYAFFLVHHTIVDTLMDPRSGPLWAVFGFFASLGLSLVATVWLERLVEGITWRRAAVACAAAGVFVGALFAGEHLVRTRAPQEVLGWGERPSLQPDEEVGWKLRPNSETHLRWLSYDYTVKGNALGFPGPAPRQERGDFRIVVLGDAYSSAEGVEPDEAWPRVLARSWPRAEVIQLAVTGWGPNQYAAAMRRYGPELRPDLVVVASFVNDFEDATIPVEKFREEIGFGLADPNSLSARLKPLHLRAWFNGELWGPLRALFEGRPAPRPAFFAGLRWLDPSAFAYSERALYSTERRLAEVRAAAGAPVTVVQIPAAHQVCERLGPQPGVDLELPQRTLRRITERLGMRHVDLRPALREAGECPYMPANLHWTVEGHRRVAAHLRGALDPVE